MAHLQWVRVTQTPLLIYITVPNWAATRSFLAEARRAIWSANGNVPIFPVRTLKDVYGKSLAQTSFTFVMLAIAASMARCLASSVFMVSSRTEFRSGPGKLASIALGLQPARATWNVRAASAALAGIGTIVGLAAAVGVTRLMSSLLFGITTLDPATYAPSRSFCSHQQRW